MFRNLSGIHFDMYDEKGLRKSELILNNKLLDIQFSEQLQGSGTSQSYFTQTAGAIQQMLKNQKTGIENTITQTASGLTQRIASTDGRVSSLTSTLDGLTYRLGTNDKVAQIVLNNSAFQLKLSEATGGTEVSQTARSITLRILQDGTAVNYLNMTPSGTRLHSKLLHISGQTLIDNGVIKNAHIGDLSATKITTGTLNAGNVRIINLDAMSITSRRGEFIQAGFTALNSRLTINGMRLRVDGYDGSFVELNNDPEVRSYHSDGREVVLGKGRIHFKDGRRITNGYIGVQLDGRQESLGIYLARGTGFFQIAQAVNDGTNDRYYTVRAGEGWNSIAQNAGVSLSTIHALNGTNNSTIVHPGDQLLVSRGVTSGVRYEPYMRFGSSSTPGEYRVYFDKYAYFNSGSNLTSDRRIKERIKDTKVSALDEIDKLKFVEYTLKKDKSYQPLGIIAQEAGIMKRYDEDADRYGVDLMTTVMLSLKGVQELMEKVAKLEVQLSGK